MKLTLHPVRSHHDRCRAVRAEMSDYLDGDLDEHEQAAIERHVRWCPNCRRMLSGLRRTVEGLSSLNQIPAADEQAPESP
jgi:predicted anti-sigma-YlaC factor YlaD